MADTITRTFLSLAGLTKYDEQIKSFIANADLTVMGKVSEAQAEIDALEKLVGTLPEGTTAKDVVDYVNVKTSGIATSEALGQLQTALEACQAAVDAIEADYMKKADKEAIEALITAEKDRAEAAEKANADAIDALEAKDLELVAEDERLAGLITAEADRAKGEEKKNADAIAAEVERATGVEGGLETRLAAVEADYLKDADKTELSNAIQAEKERAEAAEKVNSDAIAVLNGEGEGSVKKAVDDAINKFATDVTNDEVVNSYKELIDWVAEHGPEAAEMAAAIEANELSIEALETLVGTLPEGETSATIVAFIQKLVSAEQTRAEGVEAGHAERLAAVETAVGIAGGKSVAEQIEEAVSGVQGEVDALEGVVETKADKTTVEGIDERLGTAEDEIDQLQTDLDAAEELLATKAAQADVTALQGDMTTAKADIAQLKTDVDAAEAAIVEAQKDADQGIADAAAALKAAQDASAHADELNGAMDERVQVVEGKAHEHANKSELDLIATGDKAKWDAAAEKAHVHENKAVIDGITAEKVTAWDAAEANAKAHADGLNTAMDGRMDTAEGEIDTLQSEMDAVEAKAAANEAAIAEFVEITEAEINALFA